MHAYIEATCGYVLAVTACVDGSHAIYNASVSNEHTDVKIELVM